MFDDKVVTKTVVITLSTAELTVFRTSFCSDQVVVGQSGYFNVGLATIRCSNLSIPVVSIYLSIF